MSDVNGTHIYTGAWTNYAKGRVHGATITLSQRDGGLLTSFIAAFVSYVGTRFWQILAFAIHQLSAKRQPRDALHLQRQVIWRNTSDPGDAAWSFYEQAKAWRSTAHRALWRTVPWMLFAGLYMAAFAALATLSGETPKAAGNDRLIRSPRCGLWGYDTFPDGSFTNQGSAAYLATMTNNSNLAANYAKTCYNNDPDPLQCSTYIQPSLSWKADDQAECPFGSDVCPETVQAFKMTSNLIDSRADLGFNTPTSHRLQFKKITTCTPLVQEGFTRKLDCGEINPARKGDQCILYDYGPDHPNNWTYLYNAHASVDGVGYTVDVIGSSGGFWQPVPSLYVHNADTTLIFIAQNSVQYDERCNDPIFSAEKFYNLTAPDGGTSANTGTSYWGPTFDVGIIGCAEQYQFCNPTTGVCSPLLSYGQLDAYLSLTKILPQDHLDAVQTGLYLRIAGTVPATDLISTIFFRQSSALQAQSTLESLQQHYLPPNQWIIELSGWFQTSLARLQSEILAYVTGPTNIVPGMRLIDVQDKAIENLCNSQLIQDTSQTVSFSVLIIAIIFALGGIIIITSFCLEPLLRRILPENENRRFRRRNWKLDSTVHLQRRLYQSLGMPRWEKPTKSIPITKEEILIKNWNDINPQHPALSELNSESIKDTLSTGERSETKDSMVAVRSNTF